VEYWSGLSSTLDGVLVLVLNSEGVRRMGRVVFSEVPELRDTMMVGEGDEGGEVGERSGFWVTDVWIGEGLGCQRGAVGVAFEAHDVAVFLMGKEC
jgi:alpha-galactosidase